MKISQPELLLDAQAALGEGPAWDAIHHWLYWVDIYAGKLHIFDPKTSVDETLQVDAPLGCAAPTQQGSVILGMSGGLATLNLSTAKWTYLTRLEAHLPGNRVNDGKCGPSGRFLVGTMDNAEKEATGSLYSYSADGALKILHTGARISNGMAWSPDHKTFYYIDTPTLTVMAYDYDLVSGEIANPRPAVAVPPVLGWPDGMTSDSQGRLWVALWGGAALTVWNPSTGKLLEKIPIPARNVSACAFGGKNGTELFVTSARKGLNQADLTEYPAAGGLFRLQTDVTGMPTFLFAD